MVFLASCFSEKRIMIRVVHVIILTSAAIVCLAVATVDAIHQNLGLKLNAVTTQNNFVFLILV